jgi:cell division septum initiation protein DivIVA
MISKMKAENEDLRQEIHQMKRRITALERAFDSILTKDDLEAVEEAHADLKQGRTIILAQVKKKKQHS